MIRSIFQKTIEKPRYIFVRDSSGIQKKISIEEAENLFNIRWLEWDDTDFSIIKSSEFLEFLKPKTRYEVLDMVEVRYMGDTYKWGLFAKEDIPKGTIFGIFSGVFSIQEKYEPIKSEHVFSYNIGNKLGVIDATSFGNITRFFQDLPRKKEINSLIFDESMELCNIATENVEVVVILVGKNLETNLFVASENIMADEIVGCHYTPYDPDFWETQQHTLFLKDGTPVKALKTREEEMSTPVFKTTLTDTLCQKNPMILKFDSIKDGSLRVANMTLEPEVSSHGSGVNGR